MKLALLVFTALLVSGCGAKMAHSDSNTASAHVQTSTPVTSNSPCPSPCPPLAAPPTGRVSFNDCVQWINNFYALVATVQNKLPQGYTATDSTGAGQAIVSLGIYTCKSGIIDNRTALGPVQFGFLLASVQASKNNSKDLGNSYSFEWFSSNVTLSGRMLQGGFPTSAASITEQHAQSPYTSKITAAPVVYALTLPTIDPAPGLGVKGALRMHHQVDGVDHWMDLDESRTTIAGGMKGTLDFSGGMVQELAFPPTNPTPLQSTIYSSHVDMTFPRI